jgi:hypothetical protein
MAILLICLKIEIEKDNAIAIIVLVINCNALLILEECIACSENIFL